MQSALPAKARASRSSTSLIKQLSAALEHELAHKLRASERSFAAQLGASPALRDTAPLSVEELAASWAALWKWAGEAAPLPQARVRRLEPGPRSRALLEIVDRERPFQLDSIVDELSQQRLAPLATFQAVVAASEIASVESSDHADARIRIIQILLPAISDERCARLIAGLNDTLADIRAAVDDFAPMRALLAETIERLRRAEAADPQRQSDEAAFLEWLGEDHFVLLGTRVYRYPRTYLGVLVPDEPLYAAEDGLGILRDPQRTILRRSNEPAVLTRQLKDQAEKAQSLIVAKSNFRSRVHRRVHCDYVGVTLHDSHGRPEGEVRFLGLFTAEAYDRPASEVPLIRLKVRRVIERLARAPGGPAVRRLRNILENFPRDELFQATEEELCATILGIAELRDRPCVRLFVRSDPFDRFVSALLFVPRDRYDSAYGEKAGELLAAAYGGRVSAFYPTYGDAPLARVHYIIGFDPGDHVRPDLTQLEAQLAEASLGWTDRLEGAVQASDGAAGDPDRLLARWGKAFGAGYQEKYDPEEALTDILVVEAAVKEAGLAVRAFRHDEDPARCFRFKLYHRGTAVPLADVMPILQDLGLKALVEDGFVVGPAGGDEQYWIHEFVVDDPRGAELSFSDVAKPFEGAFLAVWTGRAESDGFNRLVLELGVGWREAALVRALARFRQQTGLDPSGAVQQAALVEHAPITSLLLDLFRTRFDPDVPLSTEQRAARGERLRAEIEALLEAVPGLDADRALRRLLALILAIKRTNFYQSGPDGGPKPHIAIKIASGELADLPAPRPYREIFISAPNVEGSHLRFGAVARGGLRWSDRRDDFRSEVLGLVKAQQVKNAVIVPVGSKGGFYAKRAVQAEGPEQKRAAGIDAYRTFLSGLLDVTDNIDADGKVARPPNVVAHDGDDPYLVVAADKGTAAFSDIANEVSASYGFWLGDAFASGGSAGYDHKAMGITARGAWEAVKRHFRERGKDIHEEPFTVVGVGDMSGDVFGNGMLLSKQTRLMAAFDHRDIFIDPEPDPAVSWEERKRLFELPRSSWQDYDPSKISAGGGVFARSAKSISLSPQMRETLGTELESATPAELMRAILRAPVELLYMGGIGTYVKGSAESHADAADKANDAIRIDGAELRAAVVGEGANLAFTQAGRIEYARAGGRINTDAIDNSAGVDSSDLEVNIKILTAGLEARGELDREHRNTLLAAMTDEVAELVLRHNCDQTLTLSLIEADASSDLDDHAALIAEFERQGHLDRAVEGLPDAEALSALREGRQGLTRPELAVLTAYSKLALFDAIVASAAPDDPWFEATLKSYFPRPLHRFGRAMNEHRLRRDIVATAIANDIVNLAGPTFPWRVIAAGCDALALATAFAAAREIFRIEESWGVVQGLATEVPAEAQLQLHRALAHALRRQTAMLVRRQSVEALPVAQLVDSYRSGADALVQNDTCTEADAVPAGVPTKLAAAIARLARLDDAVTVIELASAAGSGVPETAEFFRRLRASLGLEKLYAAAAQLKPSDRYGQLAAGRLVGDVERTEERIAASALRASTGRDGQDSGFDRWAAAHEATVAAAGEALARIDGSEGPWSLGKLIAAQGAILELDRALAGEAASHLAEAVGGS